MNEDISELLEKVSTAAKEIGSRPRPDEFLSGGAYCEWEPSRHHATAQKTKWVLDERPA